jgi:hypothetical protein
MFIRPVIAPSADSTIDFLWESDEFGAYVTAERGHEADSSSRTYVTLWLLTSDAPDLSESIQQSRTRWCRTVSGEMRRWVTVEWLPIDGEANTSLDGCDDGCSSATMDELVMEAKERAAEHVRTLRSRAAR